MARNLIKLVFRNFSSYNKDINRCNDLINQANLKNNHNFVNGKRIQGSGESVTNLNPATGMTLCEFNSISDKELDMCIENAKEAQTIWNKMSAKEKADIMTKTANLIRSKHKMIAEVDVLDTGKPYWEAEADILACADTIELFGDYISSIHGEYISLPNHSFYYTRKEPLGVCVGIGAWNFPFQMISWKSAPALAAGNSIIFKPSPLTPLTAILMAEMYHEAGVPKGLISVVQGGAELGNMLTSHPSVAKISFTGSVQTGKKIMETSSKTLKQMTLELGGKSPLIIFDDANITDAIKGILIANFLTQGQVCSNGTRVFIQKQIYGKLVSELTSAVKSLKIGDPFDNSVAIGAIIDKNQFDIIIKYIDVGKNEGGKLLCGGEAIQFDKESGLSGGKFISPCLFDNCHDDMKIVREEIFGPVASILKFDTEDEVIKRANDSEFGLAGGLFTRDLIRAHRVSNQLECGSVYVNSYNAYPPGIPFGGYKQSGFGRENCKQSLDFYSQTKAVYVEANSLEYPFWNK